MILLIDNSHFEASALAELRGVYTFIHKTSFMEQKIIAIRASQLASFFLLFSGVFQLAIAQAKTKPAKSINFKPLDTLAIERIIGIKGKSNNGEYKITIPQNDLDVKVD